MTAASAHEIGLRWPRARCPRRRDRRRSRLGRLRGRRRLQSQRNLIWNLAGEQGQGPERGIRTNEPRAREEIEEAAAGAGRLRGQRERVLLQGAVSLLDHPDRSARSDLPGEERQSQGRRERIRRPRSSRFDLQAGECRRLPRRDQEPPPALALSSRRSPGGQSPAQSRSGTPTVLLSSALVRLAGPPSCSRAAGSNN
jgi:hypothetical protein